MKIYNWACIIISMFIVCSGNLPVSAETSVSVGMRYDLFTDDRSPEWNGTELTLPFGAAYEGEYLSLRLEGAYSRAAVTPGADTEVDLSSFTDMLMAVSYLIPNLPIGLIGGLDVNLPAGHERLNRREQTAEAGERHDLFEVDNFGEGLNVGLNLSVAKDAGPLNLALSGAYIFKGQYDATAETPDDDLDPGDQTVLMGLLKWKAAAWLTLESTAAYSHVQPDKTNGEESFQEGAKVLLNSAVHMQGQTTHATVGLQYTVQAKNRELVGGKLEIESENSNGSEFYGWFDVTYRLSSQLDLQLLGDARLYGESDRTLPWNGLPFEGRRVRYGVGPGVLFVQNDHLSWNATAKYFSMTQEPEMLQTQDITYHGMNLSLGMTYIF